MNTTMYALSALLPLVDTTPTALPSEDSLLTMINWFGCIVIILGAIVLIAGAVAMNTGDRRSANTEAAEALGWLLALLIFVVSVCVIVGKFSII